MLTLEFSQVYNEMPAPQPVPGPDVPSPDPTMPDPVPGPGPQVPSPDPTMPSTNPNPLIPTVPDSRLN